MNDLYEAASKRKSTENDEKEKHKAASIEPDSGLFKSRELLFCPVPLESVFSCVSLQVRGSTLVFVTAGFQKQVRLCFALSISILGVFIVS